MFQFTAFASFSGYYIFNIVGFPIRISPDQRLFAPPRSFSQLITSFIASESQGIHPAPLLTFLIILLYYCTRFYSYTLLPEEIFWRTVVTLVLFLPYWVSLLPTCQRTLLFPRFCKRFNIPDKILPALCLSFLTFLWRITDSNRWPPACRAGALASWANSPWNWIRFLICSPEQIWTVDPYIISVVL